MANTRTCGHNSCEYYHHNPFSSISLPNGMCHYLSKIRGVQVSPGDNCKYNLLEQTAQTPPNPPSPKPSSFDDVGW